jgi:hypothetical protein
MATVQQIAQAIRTDHPELANIKDDQKLVDAVLQDYPELKQQFGNITPAQPQAPGYLAQTMANAGKELPGMIQGVAAQFPGGALVNDIATGQKVGATGMGQLKGIGNMAKNAGQILLGLSQYAPNAIGIGTPKQLQPYQKQASDFSDKYTTKLPETFKKNPIQTTANIASVALPMIGMAGKGVAALRGVGPGVGAEGAATKALAPKVFEDAGATGASKAASAGTIGSSVDRMIGTFKEFFKKIPTVLSTGKSVDFAKKIQSQAYEAKAAVGDEFENGIKTLAEAHPAQTVDMSETINQLQSELEANPNLIPKVKSLWNKAPVLKELAKNPDMPLTLRQAQDLKNAISERITPGKYKGRIQYKPDDIPVLDIKDNINKAILQSFPDMGDIYTKYGKGINNYNELRKVLNNDNILQNIDKDWTNPLKQQRMREMLSPDLINEMGGYRAAAKFIKALKYAAPGALGAGVAYEAGKKIGALGSNVGS